MTDPYAPSSLPPAYHLEEAPDVPWPKLRLRLVFGNDAMLGPGKVELLEFIREEGSIAGAGRRMKMSYKRAWMLVEHLNAAFREPLVDSSRGGAKGGGAQLTPTGERILAEYRKLEDRIAEAGSSEIDTIRSLLRDMSDQK
ncbi:winged helix-turn-helix domain-containing protein [Pannonibacter sp.]|uniref:winged helix-turn-helix domain-containing protein n=1 Tax=Pannonibacter sp. TaxID=1906786 RepID=UPI003F704D2F